MALLKCHECGNEVSSEAKTCPKCGAKVKKPTSLAVKILAVIFGIGLLSSIVGHHDTSGSSPSSTSQAAPSTSAPVAAWHYSTSKDDMTTKDISFAEAKSLNKEDLHWPYGPGIAATLTLRKHPRSGKNVYVSLDKGQILCRSYESCTITIRFDDRPAAKFSAIGPSDGSTEMVFIQNYAKFFAELKQSKKLLVELPMYQDGNRSWQFTVSGLSWQ
jgi:DNA-directed RNA polymerase subunit RPC12/RpoP